MLVLTRRTDEALNIGEDIVVRILAIERDRVKIGVSAPAHISILREELWDQVRSENQAAVIPASQGNSMARALKNLMDQK